MKIVVYGIGGVGGYFGGKLTQTNHEVIFIARGEHLKAIQKNGLKVKSLNGDFIAKPNLVTDDVSKIGKADLVLVCTKSWQVEDAAKVIMSLLHEKSMVLPLQNGANNAEKLLKVIDEKYVLAGLCRIYSKVDGIGIVNHFAHEPEIVFGELDNSISERIKEVDKVFKSANFLSTIPEDIHVEVWTKFMFIATVSGIGGLTRVNIKEMADDKYLNTIMRQTAIEIYNVAKAKGINLNEKVVDNIMNFIENQPDGTTASTQRDIMEGRPSELDNFNGYIVKEGKRLGIETTTNEFIYHCLLPQEKIARNVS